jgi:predicted acetyltransferase
MADGVRRCEANELGLFLQTCFAAFGAAIDDAALTRLAPVFDTERLFLAVEDGAVVGTAGTLGFGLSVPGGEVACSGVTMVGILPDHRRRGHFSRLMERVLDDGAARGETVSALWSTVGDLYGRFGFGLASLAGRVEALRDRLVVGAGRDDGARVRLVDVEEAVAGFAPVYEAVRATTPGLGSRSPDWWRSWRLTGPPGTPADVPPMFNALLEVDGRPEAYALYRVYGAWDTGAPAARLDVLEAVASTPRGTAGIWRFLLSLDLVERVRALHLPVDHPLPLLVREPARLRLTLTDGIWMRLIDAAAALASRSYASEGEAVLDMVDERYPGNHGRHLLSASPSAATLEPTDRPADVRLAVAELGSAYLGGITFEQLRRAGRVEELRPGAIGRLDALFRGGPAPWCAEEF